MKRHCFFVVLGLITGVSGSVRGEDAADAMPNNIQDPVATDDSEGMALDPATAPSTKFIGIALRGRNVRVPKAFPEIFVERAASGINQFGYGLEISRRSQNLELQLGLEYDSLNGTPGIWVNKGESPPDFEVDYLEYKKFGWYTIEANFINHTPLSDFVALRYGAGLGLGLFKGEVVRTDYVCTTSDLATCSEKVNPENKQNPYAIPAVFPVVTALIGLQIRPVENFVLNVEGGIRSALFMGVSVGYLIGI